MNRSWTHTGAEGRSLAGTCLIEAWLLARYAHSHTLHAVGLQPWAARAGHSGAVNGVSVTKNGDAAVSCGTDCTVRLWRVPYAPFESGQVEGDDEAVFQFHGTSPFRWDSSPCCSSIQLL